MVEFFYYFGFVCRLFIDDFDNFNFLVFWFLIDYFEEVEGLLENLIDDEVKV